MARLEIKHKCIMAARVASRKSSTARITGKSVFIKRYYGKYRLIGVEVSKKQRNCRDIFADAQKLASKELQSWNKKRHWTREAKRHKIKGAHRMAVSHFYRLLKENGGELTEELTQSRKRHKMTLTITYMTNTDYEERLDRESPFFYRKFRDIEEYYGVVKKLAG